MSLFSCPFGKHLRLHLQQAFKVDSTIIWMQITQELISEGGGHMMGFILFYFNVNVWWYFIYFYFIGIYLDPQEEKTYQLLEIKKGSQ